MNSAKPSKRLNLCVQYADKTTARASLPTRQQFFQWARAALNGGGQVTLRLVDEEEGRALNGTWRNKSYATNVLSFPYTEAEAETMADSVHQVGQAMSGDLVICCAVVFAEAAAANKPVFAHFAHLVVHGMLHLQGWDHENDADAEQMEAKEVEILAQLGFANPYEE